MKKKKRKRKEKLRQEEEINDYVLDVVKAG